MRYYVKITEQITFTKVIEVEAKNEDEAKSQALLQSKADDRNKYTQTLDRRFATIVRGA